VKVAVHIVRVLLGLIFFVFGLNGFFLFIPIPEFHPFMSILVTSGYIYLIKMFEVIGGALLLSNRFVPLGLILLGPSVVNILAYHLLLDHRNWPIGIINGLLFLFLLLAYRKYFAAIFTSKTEIW
jgi:putative oxidoreductase